MRIENNFTVGIEEEYMICDPKSGELINKADQIMTLIPENLKERFSYELLLSEIESNTSISLSVIEAVNKLAMNRNLLNKIGSQLNYKIGISGTHPTAHPLSQNFVDNESYNWVTNELQYYANQNITFALHIHIGITDNNLAIHVTNGLRRWVAPLLFLSCNSPFFDSNETGFKSSRTMQFGLFPRTGFPPSFESYDDFLQLINILTSNKSIAKSRHLWWKLRPHTDFNTIEFRMCDAQRHLQNITMLASLAQALTYVASKEYDDGKLKENYNIELLNDSLWKAIRFDGSAILYDEVGKSSIAMNDYISQMCEYAMPGLEKFETTYILNQVERIIRNGTEGDKQYFYFKNNNNNFDKLKHYLIDDVEFTNT